MGITFIRSFSVLSFGKYVLIELLCQDGSLFVEDPTSVEMTDSVRAMLDLAEKVFLTWDFSVLCTL